MLKWALRIGSGFLGLIVLVVAGVFVAYSLWISDLRRELVEGSQITSTPLGEIEYATLGEGTPRLLIHGTPGGYDQVLIGPKLASESYVGVQAIAVSRPGYLRTPLSSGRTPEQQADLYAALLDELGVERVVVQAGSGGAPSGLQMAIRHPDRVSALILLVPGLTYANLTEIDAARNGEWEFEWPSDFEQILQNVLLFAAGDLLASRVIPGLDENDPAQMASARALVQSSIPVRDRRGGHENDIRQFSRMDVSSWPLEDVNVPTLFLHGDADENSPYEDSVRAAARMPNAELVTFEGADHYMVLTRADEIQEHIQRFLSELD